jgi:hypothetical protein
MIATECRHCGTALSAFTRACMFCGGRNEARVATLGLAAVMAVVVIAGGAAGLALWRWAPFAGINPSTTGFVTRGGADFAWLTKAMEECDAEAAKAAGTLEFLVIPLKSSAGAQPEWRRKSLNDVGHAILLTAEDAVDGLRKDALSISNERYVFSIRDDVTNIVYKWNQSTGVKKFISAEAEAEAIERFKVQFELQFELDAKPRDTDWGSVFVRRKGTCYWVNAVLGN